jgi:DNA-binding response OmpR family regulator
LQFADSKQLNRNPDIAGMLKHFGAVIASHQCDISPKSYSGASYPAFVPCENAHLQKITPKFTVAGTATCGSHAWERKMTNSSVQKKRILFVEDDERLYGLVSLSLNGYRIVTARDFTEGLRLARQRYFDLYILDHNLPDGTGVELCRRIREFDPHTPVIFVSGGTCESDVREGLIAGAQIYIAEPSSPDVIAWAVARLTLDASAKAFEARLAAISAVREELAIRSRGNDQRLEEMNRKLLRSEEKALRAKASLAFLAAKGTRGDFARLWPYMYLREVRRRNDGREALGKYNPS